MTEKEFIALLRLSQIPGLGPVRSRQLLERAGSPTAVFTDKGLLRGTGIGKKWAVELGRDAHLKAAHAQYERCIREGIRIVSLHCPGYPKNLLHCPDAPLLLFLKGAFSVNSRPLLAIVGTRKMTAAGRDFCEGLVRDLRPYNPTIVSGFAYGVDICAQLRAMELGLQTIACMAHGLDQVYPAAHKGFVPRLLESGGMLSECWLGCPPRPDLFLKRNRLIAGMSVATIVVESGETGGSLVTADLAFGYDREVFAVPGRPGDAMSAGCNRLIHQQKAHIFQSVADLAAMLQWNPPSAGLEGRPFEPPEDWPTGEQQLCRFLRGKGLMYIDTIARECGLEVSEALSLLFHLEMKGVVRPSAGNRFVLQV